MASFIESVEETIEDIPKKIKKLDKKKLFAIACIGAGCLGLFVYFRRKNSESTEYVENTIAGGYSSGSANDGSGSSGSAGDSVVDEYNSTLEELANQYNSELSKVESQYNTSLQEQDNYYKETLAETQTYYGDLLNQQDQTIANLNENLLSTSLKVGSYDNDVDYMAITNRLISSGMAGNSDSVIDSVISRAEKISANDSLSKYSVTYNKDVDYQSAINKAIASGASQAVINTLNDQRNAKIAGEKLSYTMNTAPTASITSGSSSTSNKTNVTNTGKNSGTVTTTVNVQSNGKAPSGLSVGTVVKTAGGNFKITAVNKDGSYKSTKV